MDKKYLRVQLRSLTQYVRRLFPLPFLKVNPDSDENSLRFYRESDAENNKETTPPDNELIGLGCIWAIEFYTPTHMDALLAGATRLGWEEEGFYSLRDIEEWVNRSRRHPQGSGWHDLGTVRRSGTNSLTEKKVHRDALPPPRMIEASGYMLSLTSSLVCVVMRFSPSEDLSAGFDTALRTDRQTYFTESSDRLRMMHNPGYQKASHIRQIRSEAKENMATWFSVNLPGLFSSGLLEGEIPTCELVTMRQVEPFPNTRSSASYLRLLDLDSNIDVWSSAELPSLKFSLSLRRPGAPQYHSVFAIKTKDHDDKEINDSKSCSLGRAEIVFVNNVVVNGLLGWWAFLPMLEGFGKHLSAALQSPVLKPGFVKDSVTELSELAQHVSYSIETNAIANEVQFLSDNQFLVGKRLDTFVPTTEGFFPDGFTLEDHLCSLIAERAAWIQRIDSSLRAYGTQYGALLGSMENVRIQQKVSRFTCVLVALTIILTIVTIFLMVFTIILGWETLDNLLPPTNLHEWLQNAWMNFEILY